MKKALAIVAATLMIFSLTGCKKHKCDPQNQDEWRGGWVNCQ